LIKSFLFSSWVLLFFFDKEVGLVQGKEGYYKTKVCKGGFDSGKLRGSFFLSGEANAVALLYRKKRREGKKRENRKDVIH
jgi:hypothetical protein